MTVTPGSEDRAYGIMRNAIARAPFYANQVAEYSAEVYLKGEFDVEKISRVMRGMAGSAAIKLRGFSNGSSTGARTRFSLPEHTPNKE